jgi:hypothetical protein
VPSELHRTGNWSNQDFSEFVTKMTVNSPLEDLYRSTLRAITGLLRKLEYLAGLRDSENKNYSHWGFARVYGDIPATKTFKQAHQKALSQVLSTPLEQLMGDADLSSNQAGLPAEVYLEQLAGKKQGLLTLDPGAGTERHLNSVLHALSSLEQHRKPDATPLTS